MSMFMPLPHCFYYFSLIICQKISSVSSIPLLFFKIAFPIIPGPLHFQCMSQLEPMWVSQGFSENIRTDLGAHSLHDSSVLGIPLTFTAAPSVQGSALCHLWLAGFNHVLSCKQHTCKVSLSRIDSSLVCDCFYLQIPTQQSLGSIRRFRQILYSYFGSFPICGSQTSQVFL